MTILALRILLLTRSTIGSKDSLPDSFRLNRERTWDRLIMVEQIIQQPQAELEQAEITAVTPMNDRQPIVVVRDRAQVNDPQISQAGSEQQPVHALWIAQVTAVQF